jgi:hypothetical protein
MSVYSNTHYIRRPIVVQGLKLSIASILVISGGDVASRG